MQELNYVINKEAVKASTRYNKRWSDNMPNYKAKGKRED